MSTSSKSINKKKLSFIVLIVIVCLSLVGAAICFGLRYFHYIQFQCEQQVNTQRLHRQHDVLLTFNIDNLNDQGSNIPVKIDGVDVDDQKICRLEFSNGSKFSTKLMQGKYTMTFPCSPISADGNLYQVPDKGIDFELNDSLEDDEALDLAIDNDVVFKPLDMLSVSEDMINYCHDVIALDNSKKDVADKLIDKAFEALDAANKANEEKIQKEVQNKNEDQQLEDV